MKKITSQEVLEFWFDSEKNNDEKMRLWFGGSPETDQEIKRRFEFAVLEAAQGQYQAWENEPYSCLALLILLDQFSLNIYRDQARSFEINGLALPIAQRAIQKKWDQRVKPMERVFYYLPLEHAEDLVIQVESVALFKRLLEESRLSGASESGETKYMETFFDYALKHWEVIERFGRYPDRNPILGREHTSLEAEYMAQGGPPF